MIPCKWSVLLWLVVAMFQCQRLSPNVSKRLKQKSQQLLHHVCIQGSADTARHRRSRPVVAVRPANLHVTQRVPGKDAMGRIQKLMKPTGMFTGDLVRNSVALVCFAVALKAHTSRLARGVPQLPDELYAQQRTTTGCVRWTPPRQLPNFNLDVPAHTVIPPPKIPMSANLIERKPGPK